MKKNFCTFFIFCISFFAFANAQNNFSLTYDYSSSDEKTQNALFKMQNSNFSSNIFMNLYPVCELGAWGIKQKCQNFIFHAGNISFANSKNKMTNPSWSSIDVLRTQFVPKILCESKNPTSATSSQNFSVFTSYTIPFENDLHFKPVFSLIFTPSETFSSSLYFACVQLPFVFGKGNSTKKLVFAQSFATNYFEHSQTSWFLDYPYFDGFRFFNFQEELYFYSKHFSLYSVLGENSSPFARLQEGRTTALDTTEDCTSALSTTESSTTALDTALYFRTDGVASFNLAQNIKSFTEFRFFVSQADLFLLSGKILREPVHYCVLPKFDFSFDSFDMILGVLFDSKYFYEESLYKEFYSANFFQCGLKFDFSKWNFSLKYKYKFTQSAHHSALNDAAQSAHNSAIDDSAHDSAQNDTASEFYASVWSNVFSSKNSSLYLNSYAKCTFTDFSFFCKAKYNYKKFSSFISYLQKSDYGFSDFSFTAKIKACYDFVWFSLTEKVQKKAELELNSALNFSVGLKLTF